MNESISMFARNEDGTAKINPDWVAAGPEADIKLPSAEDYKPLSVGPPPASDGDKPVFPDSGVSCNSGWSSDPISAGPPPAVTPTAAAAETVAHERPHHPTSPSQLQNMEACPCYAGRGGTSAAAERGTKQHAATETGLDDGSMSDEEAVAVATCLDFFNREKELLLDARERALAAKEPDPGVVFEVREIYLPIDERRLLNYTIDPRNDTILPTPTICTTGGFIDAVLIAGEFALAMDWKFGQWPVEPAKNNLQAISYVLGLFKLFPALNKIRFVFIQPHIDYMTEHTFLRSDVPELYLRVSVVVERAIAARRSGTFDAARPHVPVCNFCGRIGRCPKVADFSLKVADKFFPGEIPENITPSMLHTVVDSATCLRLATIVTTWASAFKSILTDRCIRGVSEIPAGYSIQSRADRKIADKDLFKKVVQRFITKEELESIAEYSFGAIEGIVSEKAPKGTKTAKVLELKTALADSGAVLKETPFSFLKATPAKKEKN